MTKEERDAQANEFAEMYLSGMSQREISEEKCVSISVVAARLHARGVRMREPLEASGLALAKYKERRIAEIPNLARKIGELCSRITGANQGAALDCGRKLAVLHRNLQTSIRLLVDDLGAPRKDNAAH